MTNQTNQAMHCDIIRDLMPQVIDGVASPASAQAVQSHTEICPECAACYEEMKKAVPVTPAAADEITVRQAMRRIARSFTLRRILTVCMVLILLAGAIAAVNPIRYHFFIHYGQITSLSEITAKLSVTSKGRVILLTAATDEEGCCHSTTVEYDDETKTLLFIPIRPRIVTRPERQMDRDTPLVCTDGQMVYQHTEYNGSRLDENTGVWVDNAQTRLLPVERVIFGTWEENLVLYEKGDVIAPCDAELEMKYTPAG